MARTPIHPGEILGDELKEIGISAAELARTLAVPANRISQIIAGKRAISADTALRLARYFGTTPDLWMNLQKTYELDLARQQLGKTIQQYSPTAKRTGPLDRGNVHAERLSHNLSRRRLESNRPPVPQSFTLRQPAVVGTIEGRYRIDEKAHGQKSVVRGYHLKSHTFGPSNIAKKSLTPNICRNVIEFDKYH